MTQADLTTSAPSHPADPAVGRGRRLVLPAVSLAGAALFALSTHLVNPEVPGRWPTCPWLLLTGTYCPGCGTLRATHALTEGDLFTALQRNPLTVFSYVVLAIGFGRWVRRLWRGEPRELIAPAWSLYLLFWAILAFWVLRNVPGLGFLGPGT
ncbi:MAG: DUF2752 domain-containing protein [Actinobacteria bacterium]|nr:DUF2752 domain-containing protein [Actinomycetota bacterium]